MFLLLLLSNMNKISQAKQLVSDINCLHFISQRIILKRGGSKKSTFPEQ